MFPRPALRMAGETRVAYARGTAKDRKSLKSRNSPMLLRRCAFWNALFPAASKLLEKNCFIIFNIRYSFTAKKRATLSVFFCFIFQAFKKGWPYILMIKFLLFWVMIFSVYGWWLDLNYNQDDSSWIFSLPEVQWSYIYIRICLERNRIKGQL